MQDAIMKGNGNSRYLKTVGEALSLYPTYEDFMQAMVAGIFPVDFNGINKDGWTQLGTLLNKANLLSDTVISTLGLSTGVNSTPNDAFNVLANIGNVHVWRKTVVTEEEIPAGYTLGAEVNSSVKLDGKSSAILWKYSDEVMVSESGIAFLSSPTTINISGNYANILIDVDVLRGKFIMTTQDGSELEANKVYFIPEDASFYKPSFQPYYVTVSKYQPVIAYPLTPAGTHITYLTSTNRNAYQEGDDAKEAGYVLGEVVAGKTPISMAYDGRGVVIGSTIQVEENGAISFAPDSGATQYWPNSVDVSLMKGKFFHTVGGEGDSDEIGNFSDPNYWVYLPEDAVITRESPVGSSTTIFTTKYQPVTGYPAIPAGITIEYLGVLGEKSKIQVLSYVGTGTSGEANACSVTASFPIEVLFFLGYTGTIYSDPDTPGIVNGYWGDRETGVMFGKYLTTTFAERMAFNGNNGMSLGKKSADGKTFYWYNRTAVVTNASGLSYYFLALG